MSRTEGSTIPREMKMTPAIKTVYRVFELSCTVLQLIAHAI